MYRFSHIILFSFLICNTSFAQGNSSEPCTKDEIEKLEFKDLQWNHGEPWDLWGQKTTCQENIKSDLILFYQTLFPKNAEAKVEEEMNTEAKGGKVNANAEAKAEEDKEERKMLKRLLLWMAIAPLKYKTKETKESKEKKEEDFKNWDYPLAVALAHGGRIMIIKDMDKKTKDRREKFFAQLLIGKEDIMNKNLYIQRIAASHGLKEKGKTFIEEKLDFFKSAKNLLIGVKGFHRGYNIAFGGVGNLDQCCTEIASKGTRKEKMSTERCTIGHELKKSCEKVKSNIKKIQHGHFYIQPFSSDTQVGLLIGLEQSEPGKHNANGEEHSLASAFKNSSIERGLTGGYKMAKLFSEDIAPKQYGGMLIKITEDQIKAAEDILNQKEDQKEFWQNILLNQYSWDGDNKKLCKKDQDDKKDCVSLAESK